jgi:hypothetical protein
VGRTGDVDAGNATSRTFSSVKIFLVEKFVMKPVSGKIDRTCLPNLANLLRNGESPADLPASARDNGGSESKPSIGEPIIDHDCEQVLAICRAVFEAPLGWTMNSQTPADTRSSSRVWRSGYKPPDGSCRFGHC